MLRTSLRSGAGGLEQLKEAWQDLAVHSPSATPFQTHPWLSTWYRHFGGRREVRIVCVHEGEDLVGLMPLVRGSASWRTLRPMGIGPSDYLQPLARAGYEPSVAELVWDAVRSQPDVDLIDLHQLRETAPLASLIDAEPIAQATCLVLDLPGTYAEYLGMLGKSLRYDVRKLDKTLFTSGRATVRTFGPGETDQALDLLFHLHRLRWKKRGLPGAFLGRSVAFHREWAAAAVQSGLVWLSALYVDGEPIGSIYAMSLGDTAYYYQAGFDPEKASVSPGTLLVASAIRRSIEEGKRSFDFMRGDEDYKRRWKPQRELKNLRFLVPTSGTRATVAAKWNQWGSEVEARIRARFEGRGLK